MLSSIRGLTALVTGGGSGLGLAVCQRLSRAGARVVALDLKPSEEAIDNVIPIKGAFIFSCFFSFIFTKLNSATKIVGDIRKEEDINSALSKCTDADGKSKLNVLVNCAGVANAFKIYNFVSNKPQRLKDFTDLVEINIVGTFNASRLAVPLLAENPPNEAGLFSSFCKHLTTKVNH